MRTRILCGTGCRTRRAALPGIGAIKWNSGEFPVAGEGKVLKCCAPTGKPESLAKDIEAALG
jgi:glutathione peroxidase